MCKMNKWQYLPRDLWFLKWKALGASSRLYASYDWESITSPSDVFGHLRTSSEDFGLLRKWSCRLQKSQHSQDKNLTLISQKKLAGIQMPRNRWKHKAGKKPAFLTCLLKWTNKKEIMQWHVFSGICWPLHDCMNN